MCKKGDHAGLARWVTALFRRNRGEKTGENGKLGGRPFEDGLDEAADDRRPSFSLVREQFRDCSDLVHRSYPHLGVDLLYFGHLVGPEELDRDVVRVLETADPCELKQLLKRSQFTRVDSFTEAVEGILDGQAVLFRKDGAWLAPVSNPPGRSVEESEVEGSITGPHDGFSETAQLNVALIRRRLKSARLKAVRLRVGELSHTDVYVMYIEDIVNAVYVEELISRIRDVSIEVLDEAHELVQLIEDRPNSIFPQFYTTERPDIAVNKLSQGRIAVIVDGSPTVITAPASLMEFFNAADDYYMRWISATGLRFLRFIAFLITVSFTAFYVSITTFHYELIPRTLLVNLAESRARVPFPPLYEALFMEFTIEMLREAGARLPSKIGQTIGIVGGIVIGQAAVQAGFTSNILIITVASSAIASFVIPSYMMSTSLRLLRFGLIVLAGVWGNLGLMLGFGFIIADLSNLTVLKSSYMTPLAPFNIRDWKRLVIRGPYWSLKERTSQSRTRNRIFSKMKR